MRAVIYARFSSDKQTEMSIEAQLRACKEYARKKSLNVVNEYIDEAVSGKTTKRASYQRMMRDLKKDKYDVILVHKLDRLSRNLTDHINLQQKLRDYDVKLVATAQDFGDTKEGRMMLGIQMILSEYYVENLAEEVRKGMKEVALRGRHNGGVAPFGYDVVNGEYKINVIEAHYVKEMFKHALNKQGYTDLLKEMNEKGIVGKRGKPMRYTSIYEILRNEKYTGVYIYSLQEEKSRSMRRKKPSAIRVEGALPVIVDHETWEEVQRIMDKRASVGISKSKYKCSGLVYCANCGERMFVHHSKRKQYEYWYYACPNKCGTKPVRAEIIDKMVDIYTNELKNPELRKELADMMIAYTADKERSEKDFEIAKQERIAEKQKEIDNIAANMKSDLLSDVVIQILNDKVLEITKEIDKIKSLKRFTDYTPESIGGWIDSVLSATDEELPKIVIERIEVGNGEAVVISSLASLIEKLKNPRNTDDDIRGYNLVAGVRNHEEHELLANIVAILPPIFLNGYRKQLG